jgi:hypothetical protein
LPWETGKICCGRCCDGGVITGATKVIGAGTNICTERLEGGAPGMANGPDEAMMAAPGGGNALSIGAECMDNGIGANGGSCELATSAIKSSELVMLQATLSERMSDGFVWGTPEYAPARSFSPSSLCPQVVLPQPDCIQ